jgi:hypothetical protein
MTLGNTNASFIVLAGAAPRNRVPNTKRAERERERYD